MDHGIATTAVLAWKSRVHNLQMAPPSSCTSVDANTACEYAVSPTLTPCNATFVTASG